MGDIESDNVLFIRLTKLTECAVCLEVMKEPRQLPCQHTFCSSCLEDCLVTPTYDHDETSYFGARPKNYNSRQLKCPECRKEHYLSGNDLKKSFPNDVQMRRLIDELKDRSEKMCDHRETLIVCRRCDCPVCSICLDLHNKGVICQTLMKLRKLTTELASEDNTIKSILVDQRMEEWCKSHESLCQIEEEVQKEYDDIQQDLERRKTTMERTIQQGKQQVTRMIQELNVFQNLPHFCDKTLENIAKKGADLKGVDAQIDEQLSHIDDMTERLRVETRQFEFRRDELLKETINNYGSRLIRGRTSTEILNEDIDNLCQIINPS